ncbi:OLC1v1012806C1 [Oldenlandia corymbosa var. corymbosa]|uniref:OLC1v1012806C1 n=1 Tax=Oldenlandia corymbosa var. corymbosa TaxID=529605 RepID=A0AAV1DWU4_OLDCO|nr:OLC1v1012806C1 [Oldenlandia corymbosa var. corymbosa]
MISFLLRSKNLKDEESSNKVIEQEKTAQEDAWKKEQLVLAAKEKEMASLQAKYNELEAKMREVAFWFRMLPSIGMANEILKISEAAKEFGGHGVAVAALKRLESGRAISSGAIVKMGSPAEITSFPGEELRVLELFDCNIRIELASEDDSSEEVDSGAKDKEPEV